MSIRLLWNTPTIKIPSEFGIFTKDGKTKTVKPLKGNSLKSIKKKKAIKLVEDDKIDNIVIESQGRKIEIDNKDLGLSNLMKEKKPRAKRTKKEIIIEKTEDVESVKPTKKQTIKVPKMKETDDYILNFNKDKELEEFDKLIKNKKKINENKNEEAKKTKKPAIKVSNPIITEHKKEEIIEDNKLNDDHENKNYKFIIDKDKNIVDEKVLKLKKKFNEQELEQYNEFIYYWYQNKGPNDRDLVNYSKKFLKRDILEELNDIEQDMPVRGLYKNTATGTAFRPALTRHYKLLREMYKKTTGKEYPDMFDRKANKKLEKKMREQDKKDEEEREKKKLEDEKNKTEEQKKKEEEITKFWNDLSKMKRKKQKGVYLN